MLMRVTYVDHITRGGEPIARVCGRSADGERIVRHLEGTRPHFYVQPTVDLRDAVEEARKDTELPPSAKHEYSPDEIDAMDAEIWDPIEGLEDGFEMYDDQPVQKVVVSHPGDIDRLNDVIGSDRTGEADIPYYRRLTMDYDLTGYIDVPTHKKRCDIGEVDRGIDAADVPEISPRVIIADIEVEVKPGQTFKEMQESAGNDVIAITFFDTLAGDYWVGVVDPEGLTEGSEVRSQMEEHWEDHELKDQMTNADIHLIRTETEAGLLQKFVAEIESRSPDLIAGWNFEDFDAPYLLDRISVLEKAGMFPDDFSINALSTLGIVQRWKRSRAIEGLPAFDQMHAYCDKMSFSEWRSKRLDYVAEEEIGVGKVDHPGIMEDYENNRSRLVAYNILDVQLCVALSQEFGIEEFFYELADLSGIQISDTFSELRLVDGYIISRREKDEVLPTKVEKDVDQPDGGLVLSPSDGIQDYVAAFDLKSLYPSAMVTANISPETMVSEPSDDTITVPSMPVKEDDVGGEITNSDISWDPADGAQLFTLDREGIIPKYCRRLFNDRNAKKERRNQYDPEDRLYDVFDRQQNGVKVEMNSFYGVSNSDYFRLAKDGVGDAITSLGRYVLWRGSKICEDLGYEVIYGDTDSVFIQLADESEDVTKADLLERGREIETELNAQMEGVADEIGIPIDGHPYLEDSGLHGTFRHCFTFEFEKLYQRFFQAGSKKRYAGDIIWKEGKDVSKLDVVGFESQRADVPEVTETVQRDVIEEVLQGADFAEISDYVRSTIDDMLSGVIDLKQIGVPKALKKELDGYGNLPRARSARFSNQHLGKDFGQGDTPWMYYVDRTPIGVPDTDVIALEWHEPIPEKYEMDVSKTVEKAFESALTPIVEEAGWSFEEVRTGRRNQQVGGNMSEYNGNPFDNDDVQFSEPSEDDEGEEETGGVLSW